MDKLLITWLLFAGIVFGATGFWARQVGTLASIPATCAIGDLYFRTDAVAGANLYECTAPNVWIQASSGSGSGTISPATAGQVAVYGGVTTIGGNANFTFDSTLGGFIDLGPPTSAFNAISQSYLAPDISNIKRLSTVPNSFGNGALLTLEEDSSTGNFFGHYGAAISSNPMGVDKVFVGGGSSDGVQAGAGNISDLFGHAGQVFLYSTGTVTRAIGLESYVQQAGSGSITNMFGVWAQSNTADGTVVNNVGVQVDDQTGATNNWAIRTGVGKVQFGDVVKITPIAVLSLPTCNAGAEGTLQPVNNATSATFNATVSTGGSNHVIAYCNGTNWTVH